MNQNDFKTKFGEINQKSDEYDKGCSTSDSSTDNKTKIKIENSKTEFYSKPCFNIKDYVIMNIPMDILCYLLIIYFSYKFIKMYVNLHVFRDPIIALRPGFIFPEVWSLWPSFIYFFIFVTIYHTFHRVLIPVADYIMNDNCKNEGQEKPEMLTFYRFKIISNYFKMMFYATSTIFGYYVLGKQKFFPKSLFGSGSLSYFYSLYPNSFFLEKPPLFEVLYNFNLGYIFFDSYYLFINKMQSDFLLMFLHHVATISLVIVSHISNYSFVGAITFYLHYIGDMFVYFARISLYMKTPDKIKIFLSVLLVIVFIYTRLYVFGDLIYNLSYGNPYVKTDVECLGIQAQLGLIIIHITWITLITAKLIKYAFGGEIADIVAQRKKN